MGKKHKSDAMAAIHETIEALQNVGAIDKQTMRRFDDACLTPIRPLKPEEIKAIREKEHVSQTVFANYLNVTSSLVSKWERGEKRPSGASLKLLSLVEKNGLAAVAWSHPLIPPPSDAHNFRGEPASSDPATLPPSTGVVRRNAALPA
jgi:putative transcriptional regulator